MPYWSNASEVAASWQYRTKLRRLGRSGLRGRNGRCGEYLVFKHYLGPAQAMPNPRLVDYHRSMRSVQHIFMTLKAPGSFKFSDPGK